MSLLSTRSKPTPIATNEGCQAEEPASEAKPAGDGAGLVRAYQADARNFVVERRASRAAQWKNDGYYARAKSAVMCAIEDSVSGDTVDDVIRSVRTALSSLEANKVPCHQPKSDA